MVASLDRRPVGLAVPRSACNTVHLASGVGVEIEALGLYPLFNEVRCFRGIGRDWLLAPLDLDPVFEQSGGRFPVPKAVLSDLQALAGVIDPFIYVAHDIPSGSVRELPAAAGEAAVHSSLVKSCEGISVSPELVRQLVSVPSAPRRTLDWSRRCGQVCDGFLKAVSITALAAGTLAIAPLALASVFVDPILFGAVAVNPADIKPGSLAEWFLLAEWTY